MKPDNDKPEDIRIPRSILQTRALGLGTTKKCFWLLQSNFKEYFYTCVTHMIFGKSVLLIICAPVVFFSENDFHSPRLADLFEPLVSPLDSL